MFTGIIEDLGTVVKFKLSKLKIISKLSARVPLGGSMAVNGACLTLAEKKLSRMVFEVVPETLKRIDALAWSRGKKVNLETPLTLQKPLGGHMVTGHIDGKGKITGKKKKGNSTEITIQLPKELFYFVVPKAFIAIDGVSLTVARIFPEGISVALIPETLHRTNFSEKTVGDRVNVEIDIIAKYIKKLCAK